jgi:hypothetical protein
MNQSAKRLHLTTPLRRSAVARARTQLRASRGQSHPGTQQQVLYAACCHASPLASTTLATHLRHIQPPRQHVHVALHGSH